MPIYEFYCPDCHTVFSFFTAAAGTGKRPACPRCRRPDLARRPSRFATLKHRGEEEPDPLEELDESRLEGAMEQLMGEMDNPAGDAEDDPRAMGRMMRRFSELSGLEMGDRMADLVRRMEAGEDPDALEDEMDGSLDGEAGLEDFFQLKKAVARRAQRPRVDDELYFL